MNTSEPPDIWNAESDFSMFYISYNTYSLDSGNNSNATAEVTVNEAETLVKFLVQGVGLSLITGLGIIGNICSIIVCFNHRMRSSISCFLSGLALCDILILLTTFLMLGLPTLLSLEPLNPGLTSVYLSVGYIVPVLSALSVTALTGSVYFTLAVTLERYLVVCHPFLARRICTWRRAIQASSAIFVMSILYNLPRWFHFTCETIYDDGGNSIGCKVLTTDFRKNPVYNYYYIFVMYGIVHFFLPIFILVLFNILIYLKIRESNNNRRNLSTSEAKENSLSYMLFVVVAVFIFCNFPFGFGTLYKLIKWNEHTEKKPVFIFVAIFLVVLNSSLNFLIYCTWGEKFREVFCDMIAQPWRRLTGSRRTSDSDFSNGSISTSKDVSRSNPSIKTVCENV